MEGSDENCNRNVNVKPGISGQMQNLNLLESNYGSKRPVGIPPSHPHSQLGGTGVNFIVRPSHSRSVSQPSFLCFDQLPPLSPSVFREPSSVSSSDRGGHEGSEGVQGGLLPPKRGHRRSSSDVPPLGGSGKLSVPPAGKPVQLVMKREEEWGGGGGDGVKGELVDDLFSTYMNLEAMEGLNSSSMEDKGSSWASGTRTNESSENEVESSGVSISSHSVDVRKRGKRSATGDIAPVGRHTRSLSMDSFMGGLSSYDGDSKVPSSSGFRSAQHSPSNSMDGGKRLFKMEFGSGEFSPEELKKIMENEKLTEVAKADPKRVKRILANRLSAARSKERKVRYIAELEYKVQILQTEATSLSAQLTLLQRDATELANQNNEMRFRVQAMEQQARLRDALNEALGAEVQRLRITSQMRGISQPQEIMSNNHHLFQLQPSQNMHHSQQTQEQTGQMQNQQSQPEQSQRGGDS